MAEDDNLLDQMGEMDPATAEGSSDADNDEISLENLEDLIDSDVDVDAGVTADGSKSSSKTAEKVVEKIVYSELSAKGKIVYCLKAIFGAPIWVFNEILYFLGGIEHGIKKTTVWIFTDGRISAQKRVISGVGEARKNIGSRLPKFPDLSWIKNIKLKEHRRQIVGGGLTLIFVGVSVKTIFIFKSAFLQEPFLPSLQSVADESFRFEEDKLESFYSSPRFAAFSLELPKMLVNLTPGVLGEAPKAAFKFSLELSSELAVNEVEKKRAKIVDLIQRSISEWTYNDLVTVMGKRKMRKKVVDEVNAVLKDGRIKHLYINTVILKP